MKRLGKTVTDRFGLWQFPGERQKETRVGDLRAILFMTMHINSETPLHCLV